MSATPRPERPRPAPAITGLRPYRVPRHPAPIDLYLDGNEGLPAPPDLLAPLAEAEPDLARSYPSTVELEALLAAEHGLDPAQVLVTAGADDALDRACRALLAPGRALVLPVPTFEMLERYARLAGGEVREVPWLGGPYPVDAILDAHVGPETALIAAISPNNPTGAVVEAADLERLSAAAPHAVVLVDLAYGEFADVDLTPAALALPNALVFRTLSKAWGLAGLRVGYVMGPAEIVGWLRAAGAPYAVSGPSVRLARRRLETGRADVDAFVARVRAERAELAGHLARLGADPLPSQANFVFARVPDPLWIRDGMAGLGVGVRAWPDHPRVGGAVRITCPGHPDAFARLVASLEAVAAPRALLFDLDGVLADVSASYRRAIVETAAAWGVDLGPEDIARAKRRGDANNDWVLTRALLAERGVDAPLDEVTARFEALYQGDDDRPGLWIRERLLAGRDLLERLAARRPLAIVTGRPRLDAERFLRHHEIADLFAAVVVMQDAPLKPDPAPVRLALRRLGVERAWMVGDTPDDVRAARAAGVVPLGVVGPGEDAEATAAALLAAGAARVLPDLGALEAMLP